MKKQISKKEFKRLLEEGKPDEIYFDYVNRKLYSVGFYCYSERGNFIFYFTRIFNKVLDCINGFVLRVKLENPPIYTYKYFWESEALFFATLERDLESNFVELVLK